MDYCLYPDDGCASGLTEQVPGCCCLPSPILVDLEGNNFDLTDALGGVRFDIGGDGRLDQVAWTAPGSDDAWLVLDRNGNGQIDNGRELFGNATPLANGSYAEHGFEALAEYDRPAQGGNGDGFIDAQDGIYSSVRLWQDFNHNGISEANELFTLSGMQVARISLDYRESRHQDRHGNVFRYRAKVYRQQDSPAHNRFASDVLLRVTSWAGSRSGVSEQITGQEAKTSHRKQTTRSDTG
ncbi:MAG TPA: hypothetical protein VNM72_13960 [Blastocatellia bacterium]|nr:hypothetical protein [Blastocatellia bacterium]